MSLLPEFGIEVVSDEVSADASICKPSKNLLSLPINTPPDHEHLNHGDLNRAEIESEHLLIQSLANITKVPINRRTLKRFVKEIVKRILFVQTPEQAFGDRTYDFAEWWLWEKESIAQGIRNSGFATVLLHPVCWEILDGMKSLELVFDELSRFDTAFVSEALKMEQ